MLRYYRLLLLLLPGVLCSPPSLRAQEQEPITVSFSCLAWDKVDTRGLRYLRNNQTEALRISSAYRTGPYSYTGPNPIVFFREIPGPEGTVIRQPVGRAEIPPGQRSVLLLFIRNNEPEGSGNEYNILVLDDSLTSFPKGSYRVFNLSEHEIGCIFGDQKFTVASQQYKTVSLGAENEVDVRIHFSSRIDGQWVPSVNTRWLYQDSARSLVFVTQDGSVRNPQLKIKSITQYLKD